MQENTVLLETVYLENVCTVRLINSSQFSFNQSICGKHHAGSLSRFWSNDIYTYLNELQS